MKKSFCKCLFFFICSKSKFCYKPHSHIITGNLDIVRNVELRKLLKKGPKYRVSSDIDFDFIQSAR